MPKPKLQEDEALQVRLTFIDTVKAQQRLTEWLFTMVKHSNYVHIPQEKAFIELVDKAFLSQGNWRVCYYDEGTNRYPLGPVHTFTLQLTQFKRPNVALHRYNFYKEVPISELWEIIIAETYFIFPAALEESLKISGEHPRGESSESFDWTARGGLKSAND